MTPGWTPIIVIQEVVFSQGGLQLSFLLGLWIGMHISMASKKIRYSTTVQKLLCMLETWALKTHLQHLFPYVFLLQKSRIVFTWHQGQNFSLQSHSSPRYRRLQIPNLSVISVHLRFKSFILFLRCEECILFRMVEPAAFSWCTPISNSQRHVWHMCYPLLHQSDVLLWLHHTL